MLMQSNSHNRSSTNSGKDWSYRCSAFHVFFLCISAPWWCFSFPSSSENCVLFVNWSIDRSIGLVGAWIGGRETCCYVAFAVMYSRLWCGVRLAATGLVVGVAEN